MQFCLEVWGTSYGDIRDTCILAEDLGYYGFYYGESLAEIDMDCWTIISNLSAITSKIRLGPVITYLFPKYRNIALLAKQAVTFQDMSGEGLHLEQALVRLCNMHLSGGIHLALIILQLRNDLIFLMKDFRFFKNSGTVLQFSLPAIILRSMVVL